MTPDTPRRPTQPPPSQRPPDQKQPARKPPAKKPSADAGAAAKKPAAKKPAATRRGSAQQKPPAQRSAQEPPRKPALKQAQGDPAPTRQPGRTAQQAQRATAERQAKTAAPTAAAAAATGRSRKAEPARRSKRQVPAVPVQADRRYRQRISRIDMWSAAKISTCFYLSALIVLLVAGVVLWSIASAAGAIGNIETFMQDAGFEDFRFLSGQIIRGAVLVGLAWVAIAEIFTLVAVGLYNLFAELIGGVEVHVREESVERS